MIRNLQSAATDAAPEIQPKDAPPNPAGSLFVVDLTYRKPLSEVDAALPAHAAFLDRCYRSGVFLLSGRKEPRTGGVILARAPDRDALADILAGDPFHAAGVAEYAVTEFLPSRAAPSLAALLPRGPGGG